MTDDRGDGQSDERERFRAAIDDPASADLERIVELFRCAGTDQPAAVEAVEAVADVAPETAATEIEDLLDCFDSENHLCRIAAARALTTIIGHDPYLLVPHVDRVTSALSADDDIFVEELVVALDTLLDEHPDVADAELVEQLIPLLESELPTTRQQVARMFVSLGTQRPEVVLPVVDSLVRFLAATENVDIGEPVDVPADPAIANEAHQFDDAEDMRGIVIRKWIAEVLGAVAAAEPEATTGQLQSVVPELLGLLEDTDADVRRTAVGVCSFVAEDAPTQLESATDQFIERLDDDHPGVQAGAAWTLYYLEAESALSALEELRRESPDEDVRTVAAKTIDHIES